MISCNNGTENLDLLIQNEEFSKVIKIIDLRLQNKTRLSGNEIKQLQKNLHNIRAVKREYTLSHDTVYERLRVKIPSLSKLDIDRWEQDHSLGALSNKIFDPVYGGGSQLGAFEWKGGDIEGAIKIDSHVE